MSRRHSAEKRTILPDAKFGDLVLSKFMNNLMYDGKKSAAERIVYGALNRVEDKLKRAPIEAFHEAVEKSGDGAEELVGEVHRKGYEIDGRLLRPAMVKVHSE